MKTHSNHSHHVSPSFLSGMDDAIFIQESDIDANTAIRLIVEARNTLEQALQTLMHGTLMLNVEEIVGLIKKAALSGPNVALASIILCRNGRYSIVHSVATAILCERIGRSLKYTENEINTAIAAALTMNISVFDIQDQLQTIKTPLNKYQKELIRLHPQTSVQLLRAAGVDNEDWLNAILHHHEAHDGSGYPTGIKGDTIPKIACLIHLCDIYCARVAPRSYRKAIPGGTALRGLLLDRGHAISANLAAHFLRVIGLYPPGSLVELANGEIALVISPTDHPAAPVVHSVMDKNGTIATPIPRDPSNEEHRITQSSNPSIIQKSILPNDFWPN